jgi:hypothetical protein
MAEALAIIGLVSNVLAFVEFGSKLVSGTRSVRNSFQGTAAETEELLRILDDIQSSNAEVNIQKRSGLRLSNDEENILARVAECEILAKKMRIILEKLKVRDGARSRTIESLRVAHQGLMKRGEIEDLRTRLENLERRIQLHTSKALQK